MRTYLIESNAGHLTVAVAVTWEHITGQRGLESCDPMDVASALLTGELGDDTDDDDTDWKQAVTDAWLDGTLVWSSDKSVRTTEPGVAARAVLDAMIGPGSEAYDVRRRTL